MAASTRQQIVQSLFRSPDGPNGVLIQHLKINEEQPAPPGQRPERKPRYILLGVDRDGQVKIHKSKRNSNGTFSIGKFWDLRELMAVEVVQPLAFAITINSKSYFWQSEVAREQIDFLVALVRSFRQYTRDDVRIIGFEVNEVPGAPVPYTVPGQAPPLPPLANISRHVQSVPSQASSQAPSREPIPLPQAAPPQHREVAPPRPTFSSTSSSGSTGAFSTRSANAGPAALPANPSRPGTSNSVRAPVAEARTPTASNFSQASMNSITRSPTINGPARHSPSLTANGAAARAPPSPTLSSASVASRSTGAQSSRHPPLPLAVNRSDQGSTSSTTGLRPIITSRSNAAPTLTGSAISSPIQPPSASMPSRSPATSPANLPTPSTAASLSLPSSTTSLLTPDTSSFTATPRPGFSRKGSSQSTLGGRQRPENIPLPKPTPEEDQTLANVEEMLEGFEWKASSSSSMSSMGMFGSAVSGAAGRRAAEQIEGRLVGELSALEAAGIHAIVESDDRVSDVVKHLDQAMAELDKLDQMISLYKTQLNVMMDDVDHIESQNKGLQVQTSNQRALLAELDQLLDTINIPEADLVALAQESLESQAGIERLEKAAVSLYKAILSTRDSSVGDMAAANERVGEYQRYSTQFCKRLFDFLAVIFRFQADLVSNDKTKGATDPKSKAALNSHDQMEKYLERYVGLMLFVKEIDDQRYQQICASYFTTASELYRSEVSGLLSHMRTCVRKPTEDELDSSFSLNTGSPNMRSGTIKRAGGRSPGDKRVADTADVAQGSEIVRRCLHQIVPHVQREQVFVADLLHVTGLESFITFADFMELETYFRRGAAAHLAESLSRFKDLRSSMDLIFGFLTQELNDMVDYVLQKDNMQIVGILAAIDECVLEAERMGSEFLVRVAQRQGQRCVAILERSLRDQLSAIERTKLTVKKRKGVVPFISIFPQFVERIECQLIGSDDLPIRGVVDSNYDTIVNTMFECLQQMAKMTGEGGSVEDKDQLNYHVVLIENMHHFDTVCRELRNPALSVHINRAKEMYDENLSLYIRLVLRRPFSKLLDFFQGLETLLRSTPATEVGLHSAYTKSAAKRAAGSMDGKDLRKAVEALSKRIEKHFTDISSPSAENAQVLATVWQACQDEVAKLVGVWKSLIGRCYDSTSVALDISADDIDGAFKRYKPGVR